MFYDSNNYFKTTGLVFNGQRVLDLAAEGDRRIKLRGSIELDTKPLKLFPL